MREVHTAHCNLCRPAREFPVEELAAHLKQEHDFDLAAQVEKWPDGEWVIHDHTLEPADFDPEETA